MNTQSKIVGGLGVLLAVAVASSHWPQEKQAEEKKAEKAEKAKAEKVSGDIGLLDTEKNYMIVVTKDGKLVTVDYTQKTKVTELKEKPAKMSDIGLGSVGGCRVYRKRRQELPQQDRIYARQGRRLVVGRLKPD